MNLRDIQYFLAIAEEGSITNAAKKLNIAQPPLSRQMKHLEDELGSTLFIRGSRKIQLTEAGHLFRMRAEHIIELLSTTMREVKEFDSGLRGTLSIGTVTSSGATMLPHLIRLFRESYPEVTFRLREGETRRIIELLDQGIVDLGLVRLPFDTDLYESIILPNEPLVAAFRADKQPPDWPQKPQLLLSELSDKPLMMHRKFLPLFTEQCKALGFKPYILCESDAVMPILAWADAGIGIAIVPRSAATLTPSSNLTIREIHNASLETTSAIIWPRKRYLPTTARHLLNLLLPTE